jgi:hypothetical protein
VLLDDQDGLARLRAVAQLAQFQPITPARIPA